MHRDAAPTAEPARPRRDQAETHFVAIEFAHLGAEFAQAVERREEPVLSASGYWKRTLTDEGWREAKREFNQLMEADTAR